MAKLPTARPVAPGVDPITPQGDGVTRTQDPETLAQTAPDNAPAPAETKPVETQNDNSAILNKEDDTKALPGNGATADTEMVTVKTKGAYMLMDPFSAKSIDDNDKGTEVPMTSFIADELAEGGRLEKA